MTFAVQGTSSRAALPKASFRAAAAGAASAPVAGAVALKVRAAAILPPGPRIFASNSSSACGGSCAVRERERPDVEQQLIGRLKSVARAAHRLRIAGVLEALDEFLLQQDRDVVGPFRVRDVGALRVVGDAL